MINELVNPLELLDAMIERGEDIYETAVDMGIQNEHELTKQRWLQGDICLRVTKAYGKDILNKFAVALNVNTSTLKQRRTMSHFYEKDTRYIFENIGYSHYREAMRLDDVGEALTILEKASDNEWPVWILKEHVDEQLGKEKSVSESIPGIIENIFERDRKGIIEIAIAPEDMEYITKQMAVNIKTKAT